MQNHLLLFVTASVLCAGACTVEQDDGSDPSADNEGAGVDDGTGGTGCIEGACTETPPPPQDGDATTPVDPACAGNANVDAPQLLVPKWTPLAPTVPNNCLTGFEMNRFEKHVHTISSAAGSRAITLEVDIATYTASDAIRISAVDGSGHETILIDTCRMRTAEYGDPTEGTVRPPEDSIRDFRTMMPAGTKTLKIDNTYASTPTYIRVLGLCDFNVQPPPSTDLRSTFFRTVTSR